MFGTSSVSPPPKGMHEQGQTFPNGPINGEIWSCAGADQLHDTTNAGINRSTAETPDYDVAYSQEPASEPDTLLFRFIP